MTFHQPIWFCCLLLLPPLWLLLRRRGFVRNSSVSRLPNNSLAGLARFVPDLCCLSGLALLVTALADPFVPGEPTEKTQLGRDIIVAVDISLSMANELRGALPDHETKIPELDPPLPPTGLKASESKSLLGESRKKGDKMRRIDAAQVAVLSFVRSRYQAARGDRIGMIVFDDRPRVSWPLTHDLRMIYRKGQFVNFGLGLGTNFGREFPGPIDMAAQQLKELGQASSKVIILVSDGEDTLGGEAMKRLFDLIQNEGIHFYVIGIGETLATRDVDVTRLAEAAGGKVFRVESTTALNECFATIDQMERSPISKDVYGADLSVFAYFAWLALIFLVTAVGGELFVVNQ